MTKETKTKTTTEEVITKRAPRKKVYVRVREGEIPAGLIEHFKKDTYDLKLIRFMMQGEEDYRYLYSRELEGYEFVTVSEVPKEYMNGLNPVDTKSHQGLVTMGDLCLMKIDSDLRNSRRKFYQDETDRHVASVDVHILEKKYGLINQGTRSKVLTREPTFQA